MERKNIVNNELEQNMIVENIHSAKNLGSGDLEVFATPALVAFIENTCKKMLLEILEDGETTVGIKIDVDHLKATAINRQVTCKSKIITQDDKIIEFYSEVFEDDKLIGKATHKRAIVDTEKFLSRLK